MSQKVITVREARDLIDELREAQETILQAVEQLNQIARRDPMNRSWAEAYIMPHIQTVATSEHGYLDHSNNIDDWINELTQFIEESEQPEADAALDEFCDDLPDDLPANHAELRERFAEFKAHLHD